MFYRTWKGLELIVLATIWPVYKYFENSLYLRGNSTSTFVNPLFYIMWMWKILPTKNSLTAGVAFNDTPKLKK